MAKDPDDPGTADFFTQTAKLPRKHSTPVQRRLVEAAAANAEDGQRDLGYLHTVLCQTSLPYRTPQERVWHRNNGSAVLRIEAGAALNPQTRDFVELPLPAGPKARLVLVHLNAEAMRQRSRIVAVEDSMSAFMKAVLGFEPNGRDVRTMKDQLACLSAATIRIGIPTSSERAKQINTQIVSSFDIWFPKDQRQRVLWPSTIEFSEDYWTSLSSHAVPLDMSHVRAIAHSAMALDIYAWLAQRLHRVKSRNGDFVPWASLHQQFGHGFTRIRKFREKFLEALRQVLAVYQMARVVEEIDEHGMPLGVRLVNSPPPITKRG